MSTPSVTSSLNLDLTTGKPPILRVELTVDATDWTAEHRGALRSAVVEHGSLLVRGLGLRNSTEVEGVFRQLGGLMTEKEAFAARRNYFPGVYSSSVWPHNQTMC